MVRFSTKFAVPQEFMFFITFLSYFMLCITLLSVKTFSGGDVFLNQRSKNDTARQGGTRQPHSYPA